ncbi:MAG: hypothetical protein HZB71_05540 [Betaproteobacteria bacterium]|nr:hypothetical protein [Betaproteobacteria bacterium]
MKLDVNIWRGVILLCLSMQANAGDPSAAFNDAKAYAQGTVDGTGGIVGVEKAATLPHYTTNSPVPSLMPGSVGLGGTGMGKIQACQGQNDTECAAVNFLAKNPDSRLRFNLDPATDPTLRAGKQVLENPNAVVGAGQEGMESVCSTKTVTVPVTYTTEVCNEYKTLDTQGCDRRLVVTVTIPEPIPAIPSYYCNAGRTLSGTSCIVTPISATPIYSCPSGSSLSGTYCQAPAYQPAGTPVQQSETWTYLTWGSCGVNPLFLAWIYCGGYSTGNYSSQGRLDQRGDGYCNYYCSSLSYSCPSGYTLSGSTCYPPTVTPPPVPASVSYSCSISGHTLTGTVCAPDPTPAQTSYSCGPGATLSGNTCITAPTITDNWDDQCTSLEARAQ